MMTWEGKRGEQVPVWTTDTTNRLYKLVPLSLEGGAKLADAARMLDAGPALLEALERIANSEPRPRRDGHYDADVVQGFQRTARAAIAQARGQS